MLVLKQHPAIATLLAFLLVGSCQATGLCQKAKSTLLSNPVSSCFQVEALSPYLEWFRPAFSSDRRTNASVKHSISRLPQRKPFLSRVVRAFLMLPYYTVIWPCETAQAIFDADPYQENDRTLKWLPLTLFTSSPGFVGLAEEVLSKSLGSWSPVIEIYNVPALSPRKGITIKLKTYPLRSLQIHIYETITGHLRRNTVVIELDSEHLVQSPKRYHVLDLETGLKHLENIADMLRGWTPYLRQWFPDDSAYRGLKLIAGGRTNRQTLSRSS